MLRLQTNNSSPISNRFHEALRSHESYLTNEIYRPNEIRVQNLP